MMKLYVALFIFALVGGVGYGAYAYYTSSQATIALLRENNTKLVIAAETLQDTIDQMEANQALNEELNKELSSALQKAEGKLDGLRKRFSQIDIVREAQAEPNKMAERINRAVDRLREELMNETSNVDNSSNTDSE